MLFIRRIVAIAICFFCAVDVSGDENQAKADSTISRSVAKIFSTIRRPDFQRPWTKASPLEASGSGVLIEGNRVLTNAHVVQWASEVYLQWSDSSERIEVKVVGIGPGIDLALLELTDKSSLKDRKPIVFVSEYPALKENVEVLGFPEGGNSLSVTKGVVSRIEYGDYYKGTMDLRIQIDAAINPGNSGGPAVTNKGMIGLVFSKLKQSEGIGYVIPIEVVKRFMSGLKDGYYDGMLYWLIDVQNLESNHLREKLRVTPEITGVMISKINAHFSNENLQKFDVITKIGPYVIDNYTQIELQPGLRVEAWAAIQRVAKGKKLPISIWRQGKLIDVEITLTTDRMTPLPVLRNTYPEYFIYGPLVFSAASYEFVGRLNASQEWRNALQARNSPLITSTKSQKKDAEDELVVVCSPFLSHSIAKGYSDPYAAVVRSVDGVSVRNLAHLIEVLRDGKGAFVEIDFVDEEVPLMVFRRDKVLKSSEEILEHNGIRRQGSDRLMKIWNGEGRTINSTK